MAHDFYEEIETDPKATSISDLVSATAEKSGETVVAIDFEEDLILVRDCEDCGIEGYSKLRSAFGLGEGLCSSCGKELVDSFSSSIETSDPRVSVPFDALGLPLSEIVTVRTETKRVHYAIEGSVK
jgi:hypothetical protein